jgi:hypothetical protein
MCDLRSFSGAYLGRFTAYLDHICALVLYGFMPVGGGAGDHGATPLTGRTTDSNLGMRRTGMIQRNHCSFSRHMQRDAGDGIAWMVFGGYFPGLLHLPAIDPAARACVLHANGSDRYTGL